MDLHNLSHEDGNKHCQMSNKTQQKTRDRRDISRTHRLAVPANGGMGRQTPRAVRRDPSCPPYLSYPKQLHTLVTRRCAAFAPRQRALARQPRADALPHALSRAGGNKRSEYHSPRHVLRVGAEAHRVETCMGKAAQHSSLVECVRGDNISDPCSQLTAVASEGAVEVGRSSRAREPHRALGRDDVHRGTRSGLGPKRSGALCQPRLVSRGIVGRISNVPDAQTIQMNAPWCGSRAAARARRRRSCRQRSSAKAKAIRPVSARQLLRRSTTVLRSAP